MRPFITPHYHAQSALQYCFDAPHQVLGGSVIASNREKLTQLFNQFKSTDKSPGFRLITLSLPEGFEMSRPLWLTTFKHVLTEIAVPPDLCPWLLVRHLQANCDHVHGVVALEMFDGRPAIARTNNATSFRIHHDLTTRLGLPTPEYFGPTSPIRLHARPALRRSKMPVETANEISNQINAAFAALPLNLEDLNFELPENSAIYAKRNCRGADSFRFQSGRRVYYPSLLGEAFYPFNLHRRMQHSSAIFRTRLAIEFNNFIAVIDKTSDLKKQIEDLVNDPLLTINKESEHDTIRTSAFAGERTTLQRDTNAATDAGTASASARSTAKGGRAVDDRRSAVSGCSPGTNQIRAKQNSGRTKISIIGTHFIDRRPKGDSAKNREARADDSSNLQRLDGISVRPRLTWIGRVIRAARKVSRNAKIRIGDRGATIVVNYNDNSRATVRRSGSTVSSSSNGAHKSSLASRLLKHLQKLKLTSIPEQGFEKVQLADKSPKIRQDANGQEIEDVNAMDEDFDYEQHTEDLDDGPSPI